MTATTNLELSSFQHTPFYCEENVYQLCKKLCADGLANPDASDLFAVFICNDKKQVPLWNQKASHRADGVVLWDYHVICIQKRKDESSSDLVWDLDSTLPFPSPLASYIAETTRPSFPLFSEFKRYFRIVHAPIFLKSFASDRSHMKDAAGNWQSQPPAYEAIVAEDGTLNNLNQYIQISCEDALKDLTADAVNAVFVQKFGIVVAGSHLGELISVVNDS